MMRQKCKTRKTTLLPRRNGTNGHPTHNPSLITQINQSNVLQITKKSQTTPFFNITKPHKQHIILSAWKITTQKTKRPFDRFPYHKDILTTLNNIRKKVLWLIRRQIDFTMDSFFRCNLPETRHFHDPRI